MLTEALARVRAASTTQSSQAQHPRIESASSAKATTRTSGESPVLRKDGLYVPHISEEPVLQPGGAPILRTHPNLIARLCALKRAENERLGNREIWARRQAEFRASLSPRSQSVIELNTQVGHTWVSRAQPRTISDPLPTRSAPLIPLTKPRAAAHYPISRQGIYTGY